MADDSITVWLLRTEPAGAAHLEPTCSVLTGRVRQAVRVVAVHEKNLSYSTHRGRLLWYWIVRLALPSRVPRHRLKGHLARLCSHCLDRALVAERTPIPPPGNPLKLLERGFPLPKVQ